MQQYIDIHTHILPGVDDGAQHVNMTEDMLRIAYAQGVRGIIATPHFIPYERIDIQCIREAYETTCEIAARISSDLKIYLGNEIYYTEGCCKYLLKKEAFTLAGSRYVLIEFDTCIAYSQMQRGLQELIYEGYAPIIAHLERYDCLCFNETRVSELVKMGAYLQMNTGSVIGSVFDRSTIFHRRLVKLGYVHFLASDCHNTKSRPPKMKDGIEALKKCKINEQILKDISYENCNKVIQDIYL